MNLELCRVQLFRCARRALAGLASERPVAVLVGAVRRASAGELDDLHRLVDRLGREPVRRLLVALGEAEDRSVRRSLFNFLQAHASAVVEVAPDVLRDPRWFVVRNVLSVLYAVGDRRALEKWFDLNGQDDRLAVAQSAEAEAMYIAELDGKPAGCAYLVTLVDYFNLNPHAHLSVLAVSAEAEGRGVGTALIDRSIAWAKEMGITQMITASLGGPRNPTMDDVKKAFTGLAKSSPPLSEEAEEQAG